MDLHKSPQDVHLQLQAHHVALHLRQQLPRTHLAAAGQNPLQSSHAPAELVVPSDPVVAAANVTPPAQAFWPNKRQRQRPRDDDGGRRKQLKL